MTSLEERIIELETRLTFQDDLLQKLDDVVIRQQQQIDEHRMQLLAINQQLRQGDDQLSVSDEGPPPHY
jgi:SlyX protein